MDTFSNPSTNWNELEKKGELLYTAYILPEYSYLKNRFGEEKADKITYRIIDGGETWVTAGKPIFIPMEKILDEIKIVPTYEIKAQMDTYRFGYIKVACGFGGHTGSPHPMIEGRMTVTIFGDSGINEPIVYGWSPLDITTEQKVVKEYSITPSFNMAPIMGNEINIEGEYKKHIEYSQLKPFVTVMGAHTSKITWTYKKTPSMEQIEGGREGRLIVRFDKNSSFLKIKVDVYVKIKENFRKWITSLSKKWSESDFKDMAEEEFLLSRGLQMTYEDLHKKRFRSDFADNIINNPLMEENKSITLDVKS